MITKILLELPIPGSGCGDIRITASSIELLVEYEYLEDTGRDLIGRVKFTDLVAFRFRNEMHSAGYCDGSYDSIVEILDSEWIRELLKIEPIGIFNSVRDKRHFAIFLSNNGYIEIIASDFKLLNPRQGFLPKEE